MKNSHFFNYIMYLLSMQNRNKLELKFYLKISFYEILGGRAA